MTLVQIIIMVIGFVIGWRITDYVKWRIRLYLAQFNQIETQYEYMDEQS